jgi:alpha-1,6-mannosyltransferase
MHLLDTTMFFAPKGGGVGRYLRAKHDWLRRNRPNISHTLLVPGATEGMNANGEATLRAPLIPGSGGYRFPLRAKMCARRMIAFAPDLIEVGDPYVLAWAALRAGQDRGIPVVAFFHSDLVDKAQATGGAIARAVATRYVRRLYREFDRVIAPSRHTAARLAALGLDRVVVRRLGVDTNVFEPSGRSDALRQRLGIPRDTRLLVYAGRFAPEKNLPQLYEALQRLGPAYHLVLVGAGGSLPHQKNVSVLPYHGEPRLLAALLASCDAFVHAGDQETFGLAALEAMACGLPVVAVRGGALHELVSADTGRIVRAAEAPVLAEGIASLFEEDLAAMSRAARAHVCARYAWDCVMPGLLSCYESLVGNVAGNGLGYGVR